MSLKLYFALAIILLQASLLVNAGINCSLFESYSAIAVASTSCKHALTDGGPPCVMSYVRNNQKQGHYMLVFSKESMFGPRYSTLTIFYLANLEYENGEVVNNASEWRVSHQTNWARPISFLWKDAPGGLVSHTIKCYPL